MTDSDPRRLWLVTVTETSTYDLPIIATTIEDAERRGEELVTEIDDPERWFGYVVERVAVARPQNRTLGCPYCEASFSTVAALVEHADTEDGLAAHIAVPHDRR